MKRCVWLGAAALFLFFARCGVAGPQRSNADEDALRQVQTRFAEAWGKSDAASIAALFAPDADLIIPTGLVMRGGGEIQSFYASVFQQGYAGSAAGSEISRIRFLTPHLALVDASWSIKNIHDANGALRPDETGVLALVAVKTAAGWRIAALRESESAKGFRSFAELAKS